MERIETDANMVVLDPDSLDRQGRWHFVGLYPPGGEIECRCPGCGQWTGSPQPAESNGWEEVWVVDCAACGWEGQVVYEGEPGWL